MWRKSVANSNHRHNEPDTLHHITSRIAHRVYFLKDEERDDLLGIVHRAAVFSGLKLLGWCIMTNHFHLLVYLPPKADIDENEVIRRYGALKGEIAKKNIIEAIAGWRKTGESGEMLVKKWIDEQKRRMYNVGSFMKIVKQWFTEDYNSRNGHKGTLWESSYHDCIVPMKTREMAQRLGYIHLNPVRAAITDRFDGYRWSSYAAWKAGSKTAIEGMRFVYGEETSESEMASLHNDLLFDLLEYEKMKRVEEIAKRRAAGYDIPADPLTSEAMIAQSAAHLKEVKAAAMRLREEREQATKRKERNELLEKEVISLLKTLFSTDLPHIADMLGIDVRKAYRLMTSMRKKGIVKQDGWGGEWRILSK